jgi:hypothetical protein
MIASLVITPLVSLVTPAPAAAVVDRAFGPDGGAVDASSGATAPETAAAAEGEPA